MSMPTAVLSLKNTLGKPEVEIVISSAVQWGWSFFCAQVKNFVKYNCTNTYIIAESSVKYPGQEMLGKIWCCTYKSKSIVSMYLKVASSQKIFYFGSNLPKQCAKNDPELYPPKKRCSGQGLAHFLEDWSQHEKLSEVKPPLFFVDCNF